MVHAGSVVDVDLYLYEDGLCVTVNDFGPGVPAIRAPDETGGGYGLRLVDTLATRWGHEHIHPQGKRVWFQLRRPDVPVPAERGGRDREASV